MLAAPQFILAVAEWNSINSMSRSMSGRVFRRAETSQSASGGVTQQLPTSCQNLPCRNIHILGGSNPPFSVLELSIQLLDPHLFYRTMPPSATPGSRKRGRPRNNESETDNSTKKPRLDSPTAHKRATPGSLRSLSSAISESFNHGERKVSTNGSIKKGRQPIDKAYEIPDSDGEGQKTRNREGKLQSKASKSDVNGDLDAVYDFPGSDEEPSAVRTPSRKTKGAGSSGQLSAKATKTTSAANKRNGIKDKSEPASQKSARGARSTVSGTNSRKAGQETAEATASETEHNELEDDSDSANALTPVATRSVAKGGGVLTGTNGDAPQLKGILTPSKRLSERNAKSVAFDEAKTKTDDIYFADLPKEPVKSKSSSQKRPLGKENQALEVADEPEEDEEDDDEVCVICSKPDSKPPNEILFCDSCDMAVHQKCYGVARIPKGDWLCKDCAQDPSSGSAATDKKTSVVAAEAVPDIPNFEQHLRSTQRVLLDRCTGKRRIKLRGQDEAYEKTFQLVEQTVLAGEGNSMLIIGARGCGKTTVSSEKPTPSGTKLTCELRWWTRCYLTWVWSIETSFMWST